MIEEGRGAAATPPHVILLLVVAGILAAAPFFIGDGGTALTEAFAELLTPAGLLFLPLALIILIRFLSNSDRAYAVSDLLSFGSPDSFHRVGGSPLGVAALLVLILFLLYYRVTIFSDDDAGD